MPDLHTQLLSADAAGIDLAARLLQQGALVAIPTETVYGLAADARNDRAVARIFEAKNRPQFNPLIVHLPSIDAARAVAVLNDDAERLASAFWPGPLTLVLPLRPDSGISPLVTAGGDTIAVRVPEHPLARALLGRFGGPLAAPSANPSGGISPTSARHVMAGLGGRIEAVLDGGDCPVGIESTIVGCVDTPILLRPGGLPEEIIEECLGRSLAKRGPDAPIDAPGQLASHYAPAAALRLDVTSPGPNELWLGFGHDCPGAKLNLSETADLVEAAVNLFRYLHELDAMAAPGQTIAVAPIPDHGLGRAINDRLRRAAAPRH